MNKKAILYPLLGLLIIIGIYYSQNLIWEQKLPSPNWSRSYPINVHSTQKINPYVVNIDNKANIYFKTDTNITHLSCSTIKCKTVKSFPVKTTLYSSIWGYKGAIAYLDKGILWIEKNGKKSKLDDDVLNFQGNQGTIIYWKEKEVKLYDSKSDSVQSVYTSKDEVTTASTDQNDPYSLIIVTSLGQISNPFLYVHKNESNDWTSTTIKTYSKLGNEFIKELRWTVTNGTINLLYSVQRLSQGLITNNAYWDKISLQNPALNNKGEKLDFIDMVSGETLSNPRYLQLKMEQNNPLILFSAEGNRIPGERGANVYKSSLSKDQWVATRLSTTKDPALQSYSINSSLYWLTFNGEEYRLAASTSEPSIVKDSKSLTATDWKNAFTHTTNHLVGSIMLLFSFIACLVLPIVFYFICNLIFTNEIDRGGAKWIEPIIMVLFVATQLIIFNVILSTTFPDAPSYLVFSGSLFIYPIAYALLAYLLLRLTRDEDFEILPSFFYFAVVQSIFIAFTFGPYIF
jgi:hypothetical protein